ncbi:hypothetical protein LCGC14_3095030, partial [marine sediment metagenome]
MAAEIHENDIGTAFEFTIKDQDDAVVDISGATTKEIIFFDPDGNSVNKTVSFTTDGTDGKMFFNSIADQLTPVGVWKWEPYL